MRNAKNAYKTSKSFLNQLSDFASPEFMTLFMDENNLGIQILLTEVIKLSICMAKLFKGEN